MEKCGQLSGSANGPLSILIEAIERIRVMWMSFPQPPPRDRSKAFVLLFKKLPWNAFSRRSSVLGTRAIIEHIWARPPRSLPSSVRGRQGNTGVSGEGIQPSFWGLGEVL